MRNLVAQILMNEWDNFLLFTFHKKIDERFDFLPICIMALGMLACRAASLEKWQMEPFLTIKLLEIEF